MSYGHPHLPRISMLWFRSAVPALGVWFISSIRRNEPNKKITLIFGVRGVALCKRVWIIRPSTVGPALAPPSLACWGLLASLQPSKLPGHVSLRGFETAVWQFWFYWAEPLPHLLRPARASLPHSSFPSCLVMYLLEASKMPFGSFGSTRTSPYPTFC